MTADTSMPSGTSVVGSREDPEQQQPPHCSAKLRLNPQQLRCAGTWQSAHHAGQQQGMTQAGSSRLTQLGH